jgi:hypothetical protein
MPTYEAYGAQVALLLRTLPFVAEEPVFALKGGMAINVFVRDLPRLSVDIDLTYVPVAAVRWKLDNLARLGAGKRLQLLEALRAVLEG